MTDTTIPAAAELQALTEEMNAWLEATGRKRFPRAKQVELAAFGAKRCGRCKEVRRISEFHKNSARPDGLQNICRPCDSGVAAEYYAEHREELNENYRRYRAEHLEELRDYDRTRYATSELRRVNVQLQDGKRRTLKAGGAVEDFDAADLLEFWKQQGIPADRDYFTGEALDPATRSIDHLWPVAEGGPHIRAALVPVTIGTNLAKRAKSPAEFRDYLRSEGIEPAERPDPTPFLIEALANRAAEQDTKETDPLVARALSTTVPARAKRTVVVSIEEEGTDA